MTTWSYRLRSQLRRITLAALIGGVLVYTIIIVHSKGRCQTKSPEEINQDRLLHLREVCERNNNGNISRIETSFYIHIKNESLLYCLVFKSGTTSLFYNINRWAGYSEDQILDQRTDNFMLARVHYPWESPDVLLTSMKNSLSFLVVREPFERLISAYEERLLGQLHPYFKNLSHQIYKLYHDDGIEDGIPSFQDFARYVVYQFRNRKDSDLHWRPINDLCTPCLARYDFIMKLETFGEDLAYFANETHLQGKIKRVQMNHARRDPIDRLVRKYFSQLTKQQLVDLLEIYRIDFELFGYPFDRYFQYAQP